MNKKIKIYIFSPFSFIGGDTLSISRLIKNLNPLFSLEGEFISGKFGGLNRTYSDVTITEGYYDNPYLGFHEGNGEKFETDFIELSFGI